MQKLDSALIFPGLFMVATSYGLARYAYGLFLPIFRTELALNDATLAFIAATSYASYFLIAIAGIYVSTWLTPRLSVLCGGFAAVIGMLLIAFSQGPLTLTAGVAIAGVSPGLAYMPFSEIVATLVSQDKQRRIYSIINSGTILGVMLSGPIAIMLGDQWRLAWIGFALFGLFSTLWCVSILPRFSARELPLSFANFSIRIFVGGVRARLFLAAFLIGITTSIYWAFSVDLVTVGTNQTY